jgi:hypothetical protein
VASIHITPTSLPLIPLTIERPKLDVASRAVLHYGGKIYEAHGDFARLNFPESQAA